MEVPKRSTKSGSVKYLSKCVRRSSDRNSREAQNLLRDRELSSALGGSGYGHLHFAPVRRSAARERSGTASSSGKVRDELSLSHCFLHPPRQSGRNPHRPLIFLATGERLPRVEEPNSINFKIGSSGTCRRGCGNYTVRTNKKRGPVQAPFISDSTPQ
jgi:hypothetical protein